MSNVSYSALVYALAALGNSSGGGGSGGSTENPYTYAQSLGYLGTEEQFQDIYMKLIAFADPSNNDVILDGGNASSN